MTAALLGRAGGWKFIVLASKRNKVSCINSCSRLQGRDGALAAQTLHVFPDFSSIVGGEAFVDATQAFMTPQDATLARGGVSLRAVPSSGAVRRCNRMGILRGRGQEDAVNPEKKSLMIKVRPPL